MCERIPIVLDGLVGILNLGFKDHTMQMVVCTIVYLSYQSRFSTTIATPMHEGSII